MAVIPALSGAVLGIAVATTSVQTTGGPPPGSAIASPAPLSVAIDREAARPAVPISYPSEPVDAAPMPLRLNGAGSQIAALPKPEPPRLPPVWRRNAVPVQVAIDRPIVAVIIDDMGFDNTPSHRAVRLPGPLTMAFLPYARGLPAKAAEAHRRGHELLVHVPMEPDDPNEDMGPRPLLSRLPADEIIRRLDWSLDRFHGFVGVNNHMGSRFTRNALAMTAVLQKLKARQLIYVDSLTTDHSVGGSVAYALGLPFAARDVFLDDEEGGPIDRQLALLERDARRDGFAVAIGHPKTTTIDALERWLPTIARRGLTLVPVSAVVRRRLGEL